MKKEDREKLLNLVNPFTLQDFIPVRETSIVNKMISVDDIQDGIVINRPSELKSYKLFDQDNYCKVFNRSAFRLHIGTLSNGARGILFMLIYKIEYQVDFIEIIIDKLYQETGVRKDLIKKYLIEITEARFIVPTTVRNVYWINPLFFFSGDRLKRYPDKGIEMG